MRYGLTYIVQGSCYLMRLAIAMAWTMGAKQFFWFSAVQVHGNLKKKIYESIIIFNQQNQSLWEICD